LSSALDELELYREPDSAIQKGIKTKSPRSSMSHRDFYMTLKTMSNRTGTPNPPAADFTGSALLVGI
jgi:hypothetical protein